MTAQELREKFINFFESKGHKHLPSTSLIPEEDPSVLLTTAGMQQFKKWFTGVEKPHHNRVVTIQKCVRIDDIEEVGDSTHLSFFEMFGNFAFDGPASNGVEAGYFKKEAIKWGIEFIQNELGISKDRISFTYFLGEESLPEDTESLEILKSALKIPDNKIKGMGKEDNFWGPTGDEGPCGPTVEIYVDGTEIWNLVFNQYYRTGEGKYETLNANGVDTGLGFERALAILNDKENFYETELFIGIVSVIKKMAKKSDKKAERVIADHLRTATFLLADGVIPSNLDKGYVLRRLIRRAIRYGKILGINDNFTSKISEIIIEIYKKAYPELEKNKGLIVAELQKEEHKFKNAVEKGLKISQRILEEKASIQDDKFFEIITQLQKKEVFRKVFRGDLKELKGLNLSKEEFLNAVITGKEAFDLYQTYGLPIEMIIELAQEKRLIIDIEGFRKEFEEHQRVSRKGSEKKFKGGLATGGEQETKYHTATHLLHQALRTVLGDHVKQAGSNITSERLRFDFTHSEKLTPEQLEEVEKLVNEQIKTNLPVGCEEMSVEEAKGRGAIGLFEAKYGEKVKVYTIGPSTSSGSSFSREICGGPHVENTAELGKFKIKKEEASSAGIRRIKAILE